MHQRLRCCIKLSAIDIFIHADQYMNHPKLHNAAQDPNMFSSNIHTCGATLLSPDFLVRSSRCISKRSHANFDNKGVDGQLAVMALLLSSHAKYTLLLLLSSIQCP